MQKILTCAQMRAADKYTIEEKGIPSETLMERAGSAIADEAAKMLEKMGGRRVLAVCGGGNNGGDGYCAARLLLARGFDAQVYELCEKFSDDCAAQRAKFTGTLHDTFPEETFDLIIDAVFGTGFRSVPEGKFAEAIAAVNGSGAKVLSADIPSGLNGDTGGAALAVHADRTVTIGERKFGLFLESGADHCGEIVRADIGIELPAANYALRFEAADLADVFPPKKRNSNKGSYGRAGILAGSRLYSGAALLAAGAALRTGAGYTQLFCPEGIFEHYIGKIPELILTEMPGEEGFLHFEEGAMRRVCGACDALAVGMGCGCRRDLYDCIAFLLAQFRGTLVLDADALNVISEYGVDILREKACRVILTPHLKEFSRLAGASLEEVRAGGAEFARAFAAEYGVTLLLKSNACIVTNGKNTSLAAEGTPALARGGSGDVLAGIVCALAARGVTAMRAAICGAHLLGRTGALAEGESNEYSVTASDLIAKLPAAIAELIAAGRG